MHEHISHIHSIKEKEAKRSILGESFSHATTFVIWIACISSLKNFTDYFPAKNVATLIVIAHVLGVPGTWL